MMFFLGVLWANRAQLTRPPPTALGPLLVWRIERERKRGDTTTNTCQTTTTEENHI